MEDKKRAILGQVAAGTISPEEAAQRLDELERARATDALRRVRVIGEAGQVEVFGDPDVKEAVVDGEHSVRREGDTLIIETEADVMGPGFSFIRGEGFRVFGGAGGGVVIRMNPLLALEAQVEAGTFRVSDVRGPIQARIEAGSTIINDFAAPLDLAVEAGTVKASGVLTHGSSRIACEMGSVKLHLGRGSSVRIQARSGMGAVKLPETAAPGRRSREAVIGAGEAILEIESNMGSVKVTCDE
jgi:hypothetical protein